MTCRFFSIGTLSLHLFLLFFVSLFYITGFSKLYAQTKNPITGLAWQSTLHQDHPLVGKIYATAEEVFITPNQLVSRMAYLDYKLLGEIHDNPDHHLIQAWLIERIVGFDRRPTLVFEMIERSQAQTLANYMNAVRRRTQRRPATNFGPALKWEERGWPDWKIYQPVAEVAFRHNLDIVYGNPDRKDVKAVVKSGLAHIKGEERKKLGLNSFLIAPLSKSEKEELSAAHCNMLPNSILGPMATAQRYKDATLADRLLNAGTQKGAVLIAGSGHVRKDRGVPFYLSKRSETARFAALKVEEVVADKNQVEDYNIKDKSGKPIVDFIWFTPQLDRPDPCEEIEKFLERKKQGS